MTQVLRSRASGSRSLFLVLAVACLAALGAVRADTTLAVPVDDATSALFDKAKPAVVKVRSGSDAIRLAGSGFFIDDHGTVLTSSTILGENTTVTVEVNGVQMDAKIIGNDARSGLAMLRVSSIQTPFLPLGHSTDLKTGNNVMTIGYPLDLPSALTQGPVSGFDASFATQVNRGVAMEHFATTHIHANLAISPGQVGGPLLNSHGEVIGLVATSPDEGQSVYALPVEALQKIIADFNQYGHAKHGWVGVKVIETMDPNHDGRTVQVVQAVPGTPASKSGILPGDTVMRIDAREIYRPADVLDASFFSHVGGTMTVVVRREESLFNYTFAVIERPETTSSTGPSVTTDHNPLGQPIVGAHPTK